MGGGAGSGTSCRGAGGLLGGGVDRVRFRRCLVFGLFFDGGMRKVEGPATGYDPGKFELRTSLSANSANVAGMGGTGGGGDVGRLRGRGNDGLVPEMVDQLPRTESWLPTAVNVFSPDAVRGPDVEAIVAAWELMAGTSGPMVKEALGPAGLGVLLITFGAIWWLIIEVEL